MQGVSEWFDEYMAKEELTPGQEPEMYKAMVRIDTYIHTLHTTIFITFPLSLSLDIFDILIQVLLLARCWDYRLKTEDVLELTQADLS